MYKFKRILRFIFVFLTAAGMLNCSVKQVAGGGGSDVGNGIILGKIVCSAGISPANTTVLLVPVNYDPVKDSSLLLTYKTVTDSSGNYCFKSVPHGKYNIQARHRSATSLALFISDINANADTTLVPDDSMYALGTLKVALPANVNRISGYFYIPGTTIFAKIVNDSFVVIDSLPSGTYPSVNCSAVNSTAVSVVRYNVTVASAQPTVVYNPAWKYAKKLLLNTTSSGAKVAGNVYGFPVLIRLTSANFKFFQTQAAGSDLRFTKADNTFLPYEIERWDSAGSQAEIWVKTDTVFGNDSSHFIEMYWGASTDPAAQSLSDGKTVFDTTNGFAGVWHLGDNSDTVADATKYSHNGQNSGTTTASGIIGNSRNFTNGNFVKISGLLNSPENVTLSAWVRNDTSTGGQDIVSIGDAVFIRVDDIIDGIGTTGSYHNNPVVNDSNYAYVSSGRFLAKTGWHYLVFSIDTNSHMRTFYIDGVQSASTSDVNPINYTGLGTDTYIGKHGNGKTTFNFIGQIDEVRVNNNVVSPDWIKLCFMNQKAQDALIAW